MMAQQQTMRATDTALRRMFLVITVAAVMAAMMVVSALPAMAAQETPKDTGGGSKDRGADVLHCGTLAGGGTNVRPAEPAVPVSVHFSCN